jgi:tRNA threonylcarbamoyladenosine biosynthesis protein TsaB
MVDHALRQAGRTLDDVAEIVLGDGPGSFTGLRVAWAFGKGLAHDRGIPLIAVAALMGIARSAAVAAEIGDRPVAACFDALRGEVFAAVYAFDAGREPSVRTIVAPRLTTIAALAPLLARPPALVVGDGAERHAAEVRQRLGIPPLASDALGPIAAALLWLRDARGGARPLDDLQAEPAYGRPAEAQVRWEARHGRALPDPRRAGG